MSQQYILPLFDNDLYHPDNFITSITNEHAYEKIKNWTYNWGINPYEFAILIYGPSSSGKTYLSKIWKNLSNAFVITNDLDILSEELIKQHDAFIMENIEFFDEKKILHSFNLINEHKKYLLMTTKNFTNNFTIQDLASRINSVMKLEICQPDDELMRKLIFKHFSDHSIRVNEQIINYLLINLPREFDKILKLLKKITDFALVHKHAVTISLIKNALSYTE
ncbi:MAG: hypothetical protein RCG15_02505 [Candidatus Rickettsia vulgarisii]